MLGKSANQLHPTADTLRAFLDGQISGERASEIEEHITVCSTCVALMEQLDVVTPVVRAVQRSRVRDDRDTKDISVESSVTHDHLPAVRTNPAVTVDHVVQPIDPDATTTPANIEAQLTQSYIDNPNAAATRSFGDNSQQAPRRSKPLSKTFDRLNDYELISELGHGGMGVVYKAKQKKLNRIVALKMILAGARTRPDTLARFRGEAQAVARLDHPNIVQIYDIGEHDNLPFFSMEYVDGGSLEDQLDHKPMEPMPAAKLMEIIARAMHYAHSKSVVHRDLKPANILVSKEGIPKVTDFGLARQLDDTEGGSAGTRTGVIMGTPNYMAPEQAEGKTKSADHLADVYSLGGTLYAMLTGRPPFSGPSVASILSQVRDSDPVSPSLLQPNLPKDLQTITIKCLQKDPAKRYESAAALADDLERFIDGRSIIARPVSSVEKLLRWCRRKKGQAAATAAALILGIGFVVSLVVFNVQLSGKNREISNQNQEISKQRDDLVTANGRIVQELTASQKTGDAWYQTMKRLRQSIIPELKRFGLARQQTELMAILRDGMQQVERATPEGAAGLERGRVLYLLDMAEQNTSLDSVLEGTRPERLAKAETYLDQAFQLYEPIATKPDAGDLALWNLALMYSERGRVRVLLDNKVAGNADLEKSLQIYQEIVDKPRTPVGSPDYIFPADAIRLLARSHFDLGIFTIAEVDKRAETQSHLSTASDLVDKALQIVQADPKATYVDDGFARFRSTSASIQTGLAFFAFERGLVIKQRPNSTTYDITVSDPKMIAEGITRLRNAVQFDPTILYTTQFFEQDRFRRATLTNFLSSQAYKLFVANKAKEAKEVWEWAYDLQRPVIAAAEGEQKLIFERDASGLLYGIGSAELKIGNLARALILFNECTSIRRRLFASDPNPANTQLLMVALARWGYAQQSISLLEKELASIEKLERAKTADVYYFNAACTYSLCAEMVGGLNANGAPKSDTDLSMPLRNSRADYLKKASENVDKLRTYTSPKVARIATDPDLEFWRSRQPK